MLVFAGVNFISESYRKYQVAQDIENLKAEINQLKTENQELSDLTSFLKDEAYIEQEARLKLNLKKPGEKVIIMPQQKEGQQEYDQSQEETESQKENWWEWWKYFFKN